ncbi:MAG: carboxypeptidase-like regulatory domain-containing protein [Acidobacteria bacterium]|nr:carboxypeptidase-like regulatory domain-containing protein [Acidobacteriota bacterium]
MMFRLLTLVVWSLALATPAAQTPGALTTGVLTGIATDMSDGVLPGVTVKATNGALTRSAVTDSEGRFIFTALPFGWYRVEAILPGFTTVVQDPVPVRASAGRAITLRMAVGRLSEVDYVSFSSTQASTISMLVAHIKLLSSTQSTSRDSAPATEWVAEVIQVVKDPADLVRDRRIRFWHPDTGTVRGTIGQELVVFLDRYPGGELHAFPHNTIEVWSGVARSRDPRDGIGPGKPIAEFLSALRRLVDQAVGGPGKEKELSLKPGLSLPWLGTRLGHSREFDNDIYGLKCLPIATLGERVLAWINRLHVTSGRAFVEPCEELEVREPESKMPRPAAFADWVFEATMGGDETYPQIQLRRLALPGWGYQSNGAFCGRFVAYWSLERDRNTQAVELHARIADLFTQSVVATERLGPASIETDNPGAFETPVWDDHCRVAMMSGRRYGLPVTRLKVPG